MEKNLNDNQMKNINGGDGTEYSVAVLFPNGSEKWTEIFCGNSRAMALSKYYKTCEDYSQNDKYAIRWGVKENGEFKPLGAKKKL